MEKAKKEQKKEINIFLKKFKKNVDISDRVCYYIEVGLRDKKNLKRW